MPAKGKIVCDIVFDPGCEDRRFRMLQGDPSVMKLLGDMKGAEVVLKGGPDEKGVVLCTSDATFEMTVLETTNTCMLAHHSDDGDKHVIGMVSETHIAKRIPDKAQAKLIEVLEFAEQSNRKRRRTGDDADSTATGFHTTESLTPLLQASQQEIAKALQACPTAVLHNAVWRHVSADDTEESFETFIRLGDARFDLLSFTEAEAVDSLSGFHDALLIKACIKRYCKPVVPDASAPPAGATVYRIDHRTVALSRAEKLFFVSVEWELQQFMEEWAKCCPVIVTPTVEMLRGFAVVSKKHVTYFSSDDLPLTPQDRFDAMFAQEDRWSEEDMKAYIQPLLGPGVKEDQLLARYTREFPIDGVKTYVAF
eukprot:TRINITY_DN32431_c0_g1_i1.p1 TRINITY_DN32431_c0_g1~~TRINITY_DN32431_c0_g1_i1.p1  ORF type:complete len:366 (+),score=115.29 TRINITY_DN32431_c0_g1_i1:209-1306(+)